MSRERSLRRSEGIEFGGGGGEGDERGSRERGDMQNWHKLCGLKQETEGG